MRHTFSESRELSLWKKLLKWYSDFSVSVKLALVVLGFTSILSQLVLIREFLNVFLGNELIIGMILCCWMLLTAAGSRIGHRFLNATGNIRMISRLFLLQGILPILTILILFLFENQLFPPGSVKGPAVVFIFCAALLAPCCMVSGILFTTLAVILSEISGFNSVSKAYSFESAGSVIAGVLFSFCLAFLFHTFQLLALLMLFNVLVYILLIHKTIPIGKAYLGPSLFLLLSVIMVTFPIDIWIKSVHFKNQELLYTKDTPYGNVSVTHLNGQYNFYENSNLYFSTGNSKMQEEAVHFALLQHALPENVLIVSGGVSGMSVQSFKYNSVSKIDYLEINPWLIKAEERYGENMGKSAVRIISRDARSWIRNSSSIYDAIIVNTPDPSNAQINRYYTLEFFQSVRKALRTGGVFSISLSPSANYMSNDLKMINSIIYQTLKKVFRHVEVIPGERNYFIASQHTVAIDIANRVDQAGIENEYINPYYINDELLKQNCRQIMREISGESKVLNTDLEPQAYFLQIRYWLGMYNEISWLLILLIPVIILLFFILKNISPVTTGVFTAGFTGASAEFLILIIFQVLFGYIYQMLGIIVAFYMIGLTSGAIVHVHTAGKKLVRSYLFVQLLMLILVLLLPAVTLFSVRFNLATGRIIQLYLFIITVVIAFVAGLEFNMASKLEQTGIERIAGSLYAIDLAGAATGTLITSLICFPLLGLLNTCIMLGILILISLVILLIFRKKYI